MDIGLLAARRAGGGSLLWGAMVRSCLSASERGANPLTLGQDETEKIVAHLRQKCKRPDSKTASALSEVGAEAVLLYASGKGKKKKKENARASKPLRRGPPFRKPSILPEGRDAASGGKQKALADFALPAPLLSTMSV